MNKERKDESFENYRASLKEEQKQHKIKRKGTVIWPRHFGTAYAGKEGDDKILYNKQHKVYV